MLAEMLAVLWAATYLLASRVMPSVYGRQNSGGCERWRNFWGIPNQLIVLPLLHVVGGVTSERAFLYIFFLYLALDFVLVKMDFVIQLHHVVCLIGHGIVVGLLSQGVSTYMTGVVALEIGGGFSNIYDLHKSARWPAIAFAVGMTISNAAAAMVAYEWALLPIQVLPKACTLMMTAGLIVMRQKSGMEAIL